MEHEEKEELRNKPKFYWGKYSLACFIEIFLARLLLSGYSHTMLGSGLEITGEWSNGDKWGMWGWEREWETAIWKSNAVEVF